MPPYEKLQLIRRFGCVVDDTAVGTAEIYITDEGCSLSWLWVAPEYRRRGIGSALLDKVCKIAAETDGHRLTVTYSADAMWAAVMEYMLLIRGFTVLVNTYPGYCFTKEQLLNLQLFQNLDTAFHSHIVPLAEIPKQQLREFIIENLQWKRYLISHADYERADKKRSMALVDNGQIQGLTLVSTLDSEDKLSLDLLYLNKSSPKMALMLLRQTAEAAFEHPAGFKELHFLCIEDVAVKMCRRLMGEAEAVPVKFCDGLLLTELYRERS